MQGKHTIFSGLLKHLPRQEFDSIVKKHNGDKWSKSVKSWDLLIVLLHGQLNGESSLRSTGLSHSSHSTHLKNLKANSIPRSTLSDACKTRKPEILIDICQYLLGKIQKDRKIKTNTSKFLHLIDSTPIPLKGCGYEWAKDNYRTKGLKVHVEFDPDLKCPVHFSFTAANVNDITETKQWDLESNAIYVFDKGYYDYKWWYELHIKDNIFVTRLKKDAPYKVLKRNVVTGADIIQDQHIKITSEAGKKFSAPLRRIRVKLYDKKKSIVIISNDLKSSAKKISNLYKRRWEIEIFFKWIKQNLKIKRFWGKSENAVKLQILAALIVYLLFRLIQMSTSCLYTIKQIGIIIRTHLYGASDLYKLLRIPGLKSYHTSPQGGIL